MEKQKRYTITIMITEVDEYGEDIECLTTCGPDFAHTDLELIKWQAETLSQMANQWMEGHMPGSTHLTPYAHDPVHG